MNMVTEPSKKQVFNVRTAHGENDQLTGLGVPL